MGHLHRAEKYERTHCVFTCFFRPLVCYTICFLIAVVWAIHLQWQRRDHHHDAGATWPCLIAQRSPRKQSQESGSLQCCATMLGISATHHKLLLQLMYDTAQDRLACTPFWRILHAAMCLVCRLIQPQRDTFRKLGDRCAA